MAGQKPAVRDAVAVGLSGNGPAGRRGEQALAARPTAAARFRGGGAPMAAQKPAVRDAVVPVAGVRDAMRRGLWYVRFLPGALAVLGY
jgi:hypothetical protein